MEEKFHLRTAVGRVVLEEKLMSRPAKQLLFRPCGTKIIVPANDHERGSDRRQFRRNGFAANIAQVPDLRSPAERGQELRTQTVVRVRNDGNPRGFDAPFSHTV